MSNGPPPGNGAPTLNNHPNAAIAGNAGNVPNAMNVLNAANAANAAIFQQIQQLLPRGFNPLNIIPLHAAPHAAPNVTIISITPRNASPSIASPANSVTCIREPAFEAVCVRLQPWNGPIQMRSPAGLVLAKRQMHFFDGGDAWLLKPSHSSHASSSHSGHSEGPSFVVTRGEPVSVSLSDTSYLNSIMQSSFTSPNRPLSLDRCVACHATLFDLKLEYPQPEYQSTEKLSIQQLGTQNNSDTQSRSQLHDMLMDTHQAQAAEPRRSRRAAVLQQTHSHHTPQRDIPPTHSLQRNTPQSLIPQSHEAAPQGLSQAHASHTLQTRSSHSLKRNTLHKSPECASDEFDPNSPAMDKPLGQGHFVLEKLCTYVDKEGLRFTLVPRLICPACHAQITKSLNLPPASPGSLVSIYSHFVSNQVQAMARSFAMAYLRLMSKMSNKRVRQKAGVGFSISSSSTSDNPKKSQLECASLLNEPTPLLEAPLLSPEALAHESQTLSPETLVAETLVNETLAPEGLAPVGLALETLVPDASQAPPLPGSPNNHQGHMNQLVAHDTLYINFGLCHTCRRPCKWKCAGCWKAYYCSYKCQHKDWPRHRTGCGGRKKGPATAAQQAPANDIEDGGEDIEEGSQASQESQDL